ncbi:Ig-like domain-containing protein, partial [bacterium]|nr:Ig-like domain-containing protein [bacterium]
MRTSLFRLPLRFVVASLAAFVAVLLSGAVARAATPSPADWRDVSIYQILTDRFFNGDPANDNAEGHFDPADGARNHGGDWAGIEQKLDYIAALGATAIWISPVQTNAYAAYHGYHIQDFYGIAAHFGGLAALTSLVDAAHARGIYVILDVIANHGGDLVDSGDPGYPDFQNPGTYTLRWRDPPNYPAPPFDQLWMYHNNGSIQDFVDPDQILGELFGLDDLRTENPAVRADLIAAHQWLIEQTDADGFRIDTVKHVELDFWQDFGPQIHAFAADSLGKDDFFLFGEIFDGSAANNGRYTGTVAGGPFALDAVLWYPMYFASSGVFRYGDPTAWLSAVLADSTEYEPTAVGRNVNFLDNHDNGRFMGFGSGADRDDAKARAALTWEHTTLGIPLVYYGTEQEFDGGGDPYNREDMWDGQWDFGPSEGDNFDMASPLFRHVRRLNELRAALPALRRGTQQDIASSPTGAGLYAYYRRLPGEATVLVVVNTDTRSRTLTFDPDFPAGPIVDGVSGRTVDVPAAGTMQLEMGGIGAAVFTAAPVPAAPWVVETWPPHDQWLRAPSGEIRIAFTEAMDQASVEGAVSIDPFVPLTPKWIGNTLVLRPGGALAIGTRYRVAIDGAATSADGDPLGAAFSFEFDRAAPIGGFAVPAGYSVAVNIGTDASDPRSLTRGAPGTIDEGRLLLGDNAWGRVFDVANDGFVEARVVDDDLSFPASIVCDAAGGVFGGDLLWVDSSTLRRVAREGALAGRVTTVNTLPATAFDWVVAVDASGTLGGDAFVGRRSSGTL